MLLKFLQFEYNEKLNHQQSRFNAELTALRDQLNEADSHKNMLKADLQQVKAKLDTSRLEALNESEERIAELNKRYERERKILMEENRKLLAEMELVNDTNRRLQNDRMQMDNDYEELRSKRQAITQWENQIAEIIQWVSDEKDARSYLQALASKMNDELDILKNSGTLQHPQDKNWRNRRSQKLDKMELLNLQSSLQSEIQAKAMISEELSRTRAELVAAQK